VIVSVKPGGGRTIIESTSGETRVASHDEGCRGPTWLGEIGTIPYLQNKRRLVSSSGAFPL